MKGPPGPRWDPGSRQAGRGPTRGRHNGLGGSGKQSSPRIRSRSRGSGTSGVQWKQPKVHPRQGSGGGQRQRKQGRARTRRNNNRKGNRTEISNQVGSGPVLGDGERSRGAEAARLQGGHGGLRPQVGSRRQSGHLALGLRGAVPSRGVPL